MKHLVKLRDTKGVTAACAKRCAAEDATIWSSQVDCPKCLIYLGVVEAARPKRRIRRTQNPSV
jgi:hypothetical protein